MKKPKAIALFGPTAAGKTEMAILIANAFKGEIINLDSVQIYRGMDIGSAKPTKEEQSRAKHHLIDIADIQTPMNSFEISKQAIKTALDLKEKNILPVFSGGTGLYFKALFFGMFEGPDKNPEIRKKLKAEAGEYGLETLYARFCEIDPEAAAKVSANDYLRIERALEVYELTGKKISELRKEQQYEPPFDFIKIAIAYPREEIYRRIEKRVDLMLEQGFIEETQKLMEQYPGSYLLDSTIGYREVKDYLTGKTSFGEMERLLKQNTRRFAKRQFTLFRGIPGVKWFSPPDFEEIRSYVEKELNSESI